MIPAMPRKVQSMKGRTLPGHLALRVQIAFVTNNDDREVVFVFYPQYLLLERQDLFKALPRRDRVHQKKPFTSPHVLFPHR